MQAVGTHQTKVSTQECAGLWTFANVYQMAELIHFHADEDGAQYKRGKQPKLQFGHVFLGLGQMRHAESETTGQQHQGFHEYKAQTFFEDFVFGWAAS